MNADLKGFFFVVFSVFLNQILNFYLYFSILMFDFQILERSSFLAISILNINICLIISIKTYHKVCV